MVLICKTDRSFTSTERAVADYINNNTSLAAKLTITDIAERSFTSTATVSRTIRKCGYESLAELRYKIASRDKMQDNLTLVNSILAKSYEECTHTIENIQIDAIMQITEYIHKASRIFIIGCGITSFVTREFEFQLQCQRYSVWSISDAEMLKRMDKLVQEGDLVIIFSVLNSTIELEIAARLSKAQNANVVVCCCKENTPLEKYADVIVLGYSQPITPNRVYGSTSRIALQIIARTIVEYLVV